MKKIILLALLILTSCTKKEETHQTIVLPENPEHICIEKISEIQKQPNLLKEKLVSNRFDLALHAKTTPVIFVDEPEYEIIENKTAIMYRNMIAKEKNHWGNLDKLISTFEQMPQYGRLALLKNGYLYTDNSSRAYALGQLVNPSMLFNTDKIWISRGSLIMRAENTKFGYYFVDGPFAKERVTLNLFDRITDKEPTDSLLIDLQKLKQKFKFDYINVIHITNTNFIAKLYYENFNSVILFKRNNTLDIDCISENTQLIQSYIDSDNSYIENLRFAILNQIIERIPFDEPKHEYGNQLDGHLRPSWESVYFSGKSSFSFNGDRYFVFDQRGRPTPPQVCVDFLVDSFDRAGGSWYTQKTEKPERKIGNFDSKTYDYTLRNIDGFTKFAKDHPNWFDVKIHKEKITLGDNKFYDYVKSLNLQVGDIVFIHGKTPWDPIDMHSHSFFIFETDPITKFPILLAGNAGPASLRPWEIETRRTPDRYITMTIRPTVEFLKLLSGNNKFYKQIIIK